MSKEAGEGIGLRCDICNKAAVGRFCELHKQAYRNLVEKFDVWRKALNIEWMKYLEAIIRNPLTGEKAREVAESLLLEL